METTARGLRGSTNPGEKSESVPALSQEFLQPTPDQPLLELFQNELEALDGKVTYCTRVELPSLIGALLAKLQVDTIAAWDRKYLPPGLLEGLESVGVKIQYEPDPQVTVGLTGSSAAIAETGSLLIEAGEGRPLSHSLLPEIHVAILTKKDIRATLTEVIGMLEQTGGSSAVLISGPSRTADIEMTLTIGVHGPKELHVFCLDDWDS